MKRLLLIAAASAALCTHAAAQSFDFESTPLGFYQHQLIVTNGGQTLTVTPEGNPDGYVVIDNDPDSLAGNQGTRSAIGSKTDPLASGQFSPVRFSFALPVNFIAFAVGDAGGDDDSDVIIRAYDSADNLLGTLTDTYPAGYTAGKTLSGSFGAAKYFVLSSGSDIGNENSIFWEVAGSRVAAVPEPSALGLLAGSGLSGLFLLRRFRRR